MLQLCFSPTWLCYAAGVHVTYLTYHAEGVTCLTLLYCMCSLPDSAFRSVFPTSQYHAGGITCLWLCTIVCFPCHTVGFFPTWLCYTVCFPAIRSVNFLPDSAILYVSPQYGRFFFLPDSAMLLLIELRLLAVRKWLSLSPDTIVCSTFRLCNNKGTVSRDIYFFEA